MSSYRKVLRRGRNLSIQFLERIEIACTKVRQDKLKNLTNLQIQITSLCKQILQREYLRDQVEDNDRWNFLGFCSRTKFDRTDLQVACSSHEGEFSNPSLHRGIVRGLYVRSATNPIALINLARNALKRQRLRATVDLLMTERLIEMDSINARPSVPGLIKIGRARSALGGSVSFAFSSALGINVDRSDCRDRRNGFKFGRGTIIFALRWRSLEEHPLVFHSFLVDPGIVNYLSLNRRTSRKWE